MTTESLAILHCLRAPVGGLFRHVRDLAIEQSARGHQVGVLVDTKASDALTESRLANLSSHLALGLHRAIITRGLGPRDFAAVAETKRLARSLSIDVIHGHGAKGGACARLAGADLKKKGQSIKTFYTPHGGSLHYGPNTIKGKVFLKLENILAKSTDGLIFECNFARDEYQKHVGEDLAPSRVIPNGLHEHEFQSVTPLADASDFVFVGELRDLKGVHVLLETIALISTTHEVSCAIVGSGPDEQSYFGRAKTLGIDRVVKFHGAVPAKKAFQLGKILVIPSLKESFPYIVLEAGAAGLPIIATRVGGINEIVEGTNVTLVEPNNISSLRQSMLNKKDNLITARKHANELRNSIQQRFTVKKMVDDIMNFYDEATSY